MLNHLADVCNSHYESALHEVGGGWLDGACWHLASAVHDILLEDVEEDGLVIIEVQPQAIPTPSETEFFEVRFDKGVPPSAIKQIFDEKWRPYEVDVKQDVLRSNALLNSQNSQSTPGL